MSALKKPKTGPAPAPIGGLYDRDPVTGANRFKYVPAAVSDIRATFNRVRLEIAQGRRKL